MNRYVLIGIAILVIIAALLWFFWPKSREREFETAPRIVQTPQSYEPARPAGEIESRKAAQERYSFRFFDTIAPLVKPFEELLNITPLNNPSEPPLSLRGGDKNDKISSPLNVRGARGVIGKGERELSNGARGVTENPLSEQEIFNWIWPEDYRRGLTEIETLYINASYIASRPPTNFDDEQNIYQFLAETLDVAETNGWVNASDAIVLRKGLKETLPRVIEHDKNLLRQGLMPISFLPKDIDIAKLRWVIFANIAQASPGWVTSPDCYKDDLSLNLIPGPNLWAPCCNCGWFCTPKGCKFFADCGAQSVKCNIPAGCLNLTCRTFPNAIWDPLTGICGCG